MTGARPSVLVIGYGNPGRLDDGLGPAFAAAIEDLGLEGVAVDAAYQLNVEDAAEAARHGVVIFADASVDGPEPFFFERIDPAPAAVGYTSHSVEPAELLGLARSLFGATPAGYALGLRGQEFNEFGERLSGRARSNLAEAVGTFRTVIAERRFREAERRFSRAVAGAARRGGEGA